MPFQDPSAPAPAAASKIEIDNSAPEPGILPPLRVLLVEDNADDALLLKRLFERAGYRARMQRVETSAEMEAALSSDEAWDVVLADFHLPTFSAPEALKLLKSLGHDLPFIIMSGAISEDTAVEAMRAGAHDYISKQNLARLVPAIEREIREAQARRLRLSAERALESSQARFLDLVRAMPVGLIIAEPDGAIRYANATIERLLGYPVDDLRAGRVSLDSIFGAEAGPLLGRVRQEGGSRSFEAVCRCRDRSHLPALVALAPLAAEAGAEASPGGGQVALFFVDLSEQKRTEEVMRRTEKLAATGRLAASIAHEINNPLEAVTNCLFLLGSSSLEPRAREYLRIAQQELDRVTHITTQTLRFYRQSTRPVETNVNELLDSVVALYEPRLRSYSIALRRQYRDVPTLHAYEGEIRQVLANFVGNAIDAMQRWGGWLTLRSATGHARRSGTAGAGIPGVYVTIADTGCGMDASTRARIFEPFFSTKGNTGTGLGLWVSQTIIDKHNGHIGIRSRVRGEGGGGTVFRIFLPLSSADAAASHSTL